MKGGGRKRGAQSEDGGGGGGEKEKKRGGTEEQIVESEGLVEQNKEGEGDREEEEEEGEEEDDEGEEGKEEEDNDEGKDEERTNLTDDFYEIETIRRKRKYKGQLQYLVKWRGWPETANTWEPLENLLACTDFIDAFEERLRSGKHNRKRKRKYGGPHTQYKKKQPRSSAATCNATGLRSSAATCNTTGLEISIVDNSLSLVPLDNSRIVDLTASSPVTVSIHEGESIGNANNVKITNRVKENGSGNGSKQIDEGQDDDYDTKLSELKGAISSNGLNADKLTTRFREGNGFKGDGPATGLPKVDPGESVQSDRRTGAKRRKSGPVKRFKQELASSGSNLTQNAISNIQVAYGITNTQVGTENLGLTVDGLSNRLHIDNSINVPVITKILKPVGFSASISDNIQDVSVTFLAIRSDGEQVVVDNSYLKANNPLLLINFYEQHLKYNPTPLITET